MDVLLWVEPLHRLPHLFRVESMSKRGLHPRGARRVKSRTRRRLLKTSWNERLSLELGLHTGELKSRLGSETTPWRLHLIDLLLSRL